MLRTLLVPLLVTGLAAGCSLTPPDYTGKSCETGICPRGYGCVNAACYPLDALPEPTFEWVESTKLPVTLTAHAAVAHAGKLFVIGGFSGSAFTEKVYVADIQADGSLSSWTEGPSLPSARGGHSAVVLDEALFVIGGCLSGAPGGCSDFSRDVLVNPFNADGTLQATWNTDAPLLPVATGEHASAVLNGSIYVLGGRTSQGDVTRAVTLRVDFSRAPATWTWASTQGLTTARSQHSAVAQGGLIIVLGGRGADGNAIALIEQAPVEANGLLGAWTSAGTLSSPRRSLAATTQDNLLFALGGCTTSLPCTEISPASESMKLAANGTFEPAEKFDAMPSAVAGAAIVSFGRSLYLIGGRAATGLSDGVLRTSNRSTLTIQGPQETVGTPGGVGLQSFGAAANSNFLYVVGGTDGTTARSDVSFAAVQSTGLAAFQSAGAMTGPQAGHCAFVANNLIYSVGGYDQANVLLNEVRRSPLNTSTGAPGAWTVVKSLPSARKFHACAAASGVAYLVGGETAGGLVSDVWYSRIDPATGDMSDWLSAPALPGGRIDLAALVSNGFLYVAGGFDGTAPVRDVLVSKLDEAGNPGPWSRAPEPSIARRAPSLAVTPNGSHLFLLGGARSIFGQPVRPTSSMEVANLGANAAISQWSEASTRLMTARYDAQVLQVGGRIFVVSGVIQATPTTRTPSIEVIDATSP